MSFLFDFSYTVAGERQVSGLFPRLETQLSDFTEPLTEIMGGVEDETGHQFGQEGEPDWDDLEPRYEAQKRKRWGEQPILQASHALMLSLTDRSHKDAVAEVTPLSMRRGTSITVGTGRHWNLGLIHQLGAPRANIPARPMMRIRRAFQILARSILADWLFDQGEGSSTYS
ncbi:MAG TPA: phage virion morphogenesis protein [Armatimonadota bacterium]|nr:phage virion morphogenesis protein [Armatimonadota bacterium]